MSKKTSWKLISKIPLKPDLSQEIYNILKEYREGFGDLPDTFLLTNKKKVVAWGEFETEILYSEDIAPNGTVLDMIIPGLLYMYRWDPTAHFWEFTYFNIKKIRRPKIFARYFPDISEGEHLYKYFTGNG